MASVSPNTETRDRARQARDSRWLLRDAAQRITSLNRVRVCGRRLAHTSTQAAVVLNEFGVAGLSGVQTCGSVWACAMCAARVRKARQDELERAALAHVDAGGGIEFVTATLRHRLADDLAAGLRAAAESWRDVMRDHAVRALRDSFGFGFIRALEVTYTWANGWHAHLHIVLMTDTEWNADTRAAALAAISSVWIASAKKYTGRKPDKKHGVVWEHVPVHHREQKDAHGAVRSVVRYLAKTQEDGRRWGLASEMARGDLKRGRGADSVHPLDMPMLAQGFDENGEVVPAAQARRLAALWGTYERATHGRKMLTWSKGLRARLLPDEPELTDEELAEDEPTKTVVGLVSRDEFYALRRANLVYTALVAAEETGWSGLEYVKGLAMQQAALGGWLSPDAHAVWAATERPQTLTA